MFVRILLGLMLGITTLFYSMQSDSWVYTQIETFIFEMLSHNYGCRVEGNLKRLSIAIPEITIHNLRMEAYDNSWKWSAKEYRAGFVWSQFIRDKMIYFWMSLRSVDADSIIINNAPAIMPHVKKILAEPDLPIAIKLDTASIHDGRLTLRTDCVQSHIVWDLSARKAGSVLASRIKIHDGTLNYKATMCMRSLQGVIHFDSDRDHEIFRCDLRCMIPQLGAYPICFLKGSWQAGAGRFYIESIDKSIRINPLIIKSHNDAVHVVLQAVFPLSLFYMAYFDSTSSPLQGACTVKLNGSFSEQGDLDGYIVTEDITHPLLSDPCIVSGTFSKQKKSVQGSIDIKSGLYHAVHGVFQGETDLIGSMTMMNESSLTVPYVNGWHIEPHNGILNASFDVQNNKGKINYSCVAQHAISHQLIKSSGFLNVLEDNEFEIKGFCGDYQYQAQGSWLDRFIRSAQLHYASQLDHSVAIRARRLGCQEYEVRANFYYLRMIAKMLWNIDIAGEGELVGHYKGALNDCRCNISLEDATIRLPQTYNCINEMTCFIHGDLYKQQLSLSDLCVRFHNGLLQSKHAQLWFGPHWGLSFMHMPISLDRCLVSLKHDLFATVSGDLIVSKRGEESPHISGNIFIDKGQLKENIFSSEFQKKLLHQKRIGQAPDFFTCNLSIETKDPIRVDTSFLKADAHVDIRVSGSTALPQIEGIVSVPSGSIGFPYKPLLISKGEIRFMPEHSLNPMVEIYAKNTIKNHLISLHVTGSLQDNIVLLESSPPLTQEQIVGLLIAGAHENSLDALIPALLMRNITNYIVDTHSSNFFDRYIKPWMKQINVHLKPKFGDQSGRGGIRGALEIVVNDRWRATIEKNFTLTEDTHFELEYTLSDDVAFRVLRDERCDIGGEVEMRWKF